MSPKSLDPEGAPERIFLSTVVTPKVLADHLDIPEDEAEELFEAGYFNAQKVGGRWMASKFAILEWLERDPDSPAQLRVLAGHEHKTRPDSHRHVKSDPVNDGDPDDEDETS